MKKSKGSKELDNKTGDVKSDNASGSSALRRSGRNCGGSESVKGVETPSPSRKAERLNKEKKEENSPRKSERLNKDKKEESPSQRRSKRLGTPTLSDKSGKSPSMINVKRRKVSVETSGIENTEGKKRLDARHFKSLFTEQRKRTVLALATEGPKLLEKPCLSLCNGVDSQEANDKHDSINNQIENKLPKRLEDAVEIPDLSDNMAVEVQRERVIPIGDDEPTERNVDSEFHVNNYEGSPVKLDSLNSMSLDEVEYVSSSSHNEKSVEGGDIYASVSEEIPPVSSHGSKDSASHVESDRLEIDSDGEVNLVQPNAIAGDKLLQVDVNVEDEKENADALDQRVRIPLIDSAEILVCNSVHISRNGNEADNIPGKSASSPRNQRFVEYWVPARLSNLQLEQYCAALLSNSISLCSSLKSDPMGVLRNLLITLRQTCSHPFLVDKSLSSSLLKDVQVTEYLDVGIKASGKLQLLDSMLLEMRKRGLRVLIIYESIDGRDGIGDILDDYLRQRFGQDSYEHVDGGSFLPSKKQAVLNKFNDKESGRFAFLLETHACLPSIKLSSVDAIIIHNSEWNPINDIKSLQKIVIDSQNNPIKVFRLFLPQTVEGNAMLLSKHNVTIDNSMHTISQSNRDKLLMNGASDLFDELERFHRVTAPISSLISSTESSLLHDVVQELMTILLQNGKEMVDGRSICLKMQNGGAQSKYYLVSDELNTPIEETWPRDFWSKLLEGKNPEWKYVSSLYQRNRKRVRYAEGIDPQSNKNDFVKKRRKVAHDDVGITPAVENEKVAASDKDSGCDENLSESLHPSSESVSVKDVHTSDVRNFNNAVKTGNMLGKKGLFLKLKLELGKLGEILDMPEDVKTIAERFLEYVLENLDLRKEPVNMLQAFQLSVCWVAASLRKLQINCQESLALAKQQLKFCCNEDDADYMYLMMGLFKELFILRVVNDRTNGHAYDKAFKELDPEKLMVKIIKLIKKKSLQRFEILTQKQLIELEQLEKSVYAEKAQLEQQYKLETAVVRSIHARNSSIAASKIREIEEQFSKKLEEHQNNKATRLKRLEEKHLFERDNEKTLTSFWKDDIVKEQLDLLRKLPLNDYENICFSNDQPMVHEGNKNDLLSGNPEIIKSKPVVLTGREEAGQSRVPDSAAPETINESFGVVSEVPTSAEVLMEDSMIDDSQSRSRHSTVVNQHQLEPDAPATECNVPLHPSLLAPDNEGDDSSPVGCTLPQPDDSVPPVDVPATEERQAELLSPNDTPSIEQSITDDAVGSSAAELLRQLPQLSSELNSGEPVPHLQPSHGRDFIQNTGNTIGSSTADILHQLPHSSSDPNTGEPIPHSQQSHERDSIQDLVVGNNIELPNPSQLPAAVSVACTQPTSAASLPVSIPRPRDTHVASDAANLVLPDRSSGSTVSTRVPFVYLDPLQGELERIQKEAEKSIKLYEDQKQHLNSECEKEIEEAVARIRKQYEAKSLELDVVFECKKNNLDSYHKKVFMNKMLAEAFRNKCMEIKVPPSGMSRDNIQRQMTRPLSGQQMAPGASSGNLQPTRSSAQQRNLQVTQSLLHPSSHTGAATQTPLHPPGPSRFAAGQASGNPQTVHNQMRVNVTTGSSTVAHLPRRNTPSGSGLMPSRQYHVPPLRNPVDTSSPIQAVISLPVQAANSTSALFSSNSSRPIVSTPTVNFNPVSGMRAMPPHLRARVSQPQAPNPISSSSPSLPITSSQPQYSNVTLTAPSAANASDRHSARLMRGEIDTMPNNQTSGGNRPNTLVTSAPTTPVVVYLSDD